MRPVRLTLTEGPQVRPQVQLGVDDIAAQLACGVVQQKNSASHRVPSVTVGAWRSFSSASRAGSSSVELIDRNSRVTKLDAEIPGGASAIVALDGSGVQLGNNGGNLVLQDDQANQVDSVTYSAADAGIVDRYVRFHR